jgi:hypothetical protein
VSTLPSIPIPTCIVTMSRAEFLERFGCPDVRGALCGYTRQDDTRAFLRKGDMEGATPGGQGWADEEMGAALASVGPEDVARTGGETLVAFGVRPS